MSKPVDETSAVRQVLDELRATGWEFVCLEYMATGDLTEVENLSPEQLLNEIMGRDPVFVIVQHNDLEAVGWLQLVFGNDPIEVVADYTTNLESVMSTLAERWMKR